MNLMFFSSNIPFGCEFATIEIEDNALIRQRSTSMWLSTRKIRLHRLPFGPSHIAKLMDTGTGVACSANTVNRRLEVVPSRTHYKYCIRQPFGCLYSTNARRIVFVNWRPAPVKEKRCVFAWIQFSSFSLKSGIQSNARCSTWRSVANRANRINFESINDAFRLRWETWIPSRKSSKIIGSSHQGFVFLRISLPRMNECFCRLCLFLVARHRHWRFGKVWPENAKTMRPYFRDIISWARISCRILLAVFDYRTRYHISKPMTIFAKKSFRIFCQTYLNSIDFCASMRSPLTSISIEDNFAFRWSVLLPLSYSVIAQVLSNNCQFAIFAHKKNVLKRNGNPTMRRWAEAYDTLCFRNTLHAYRIAGRCIWFRCALQFKFRCKCQQPARSGDMWYERNAMRACSSRRRRCMRASYLFVWFHKLRWMINAFYWIRNK